MDRSCIIQKYGLVASDLIIKPDISKLLSFQEEGDLMARYFKVGREKFNLEGDVLYTFFEENWNAYHEQLILRQKYKTLHGDVQHLVEMIPKRKMIVDKQKNIIMMDITLTGMINNDTEKQRRQMAVCFETLERLIQELLELRQIEHELEMKKLEEKRTLKKIYDAEDKALEVMQHYINNELNKQLQENRATNKTDSEIEQQNIVARRECKTENNIENNNIVNKTDIPENKHHTDFHKKRLLNEKLLVMAIDSNNDSHKQTTKSEKVDTVCKNDTRKDLLNTEMIASAQTEKDANLKQEKTENYTSTMYVEINTKQEYRKKWNEIGINDVSKQVSYDKKTFNNQTNKSFHRSRPPRLTPISVLYASVASNYMGKKSSKEWIILPKSKFFGFGNRNKWKEECMKRNWRDKANETCKICLCTLWSDMCRSHGQCLKCSASRG